MWKGMWKGKQILPAQWIKESTGKFVIGTSVVSDKLDYGYLWWRYSERHEEIHQLIGDNEAYFACGTGGQFIWVIPILNVVIVSTADQPFMPNRWGNKGGGFISESMLWEYIIPACKKTGGQK